MKYLFEIMLDFFGRLVFNSLGSISLKCFSRVYCQKSGKEDVTWADFGLRKNKLRTLASR